ncbi:MAG TPA: benzoyl-CoA 2,3-epoxidase subunit BoxB [Candidatus Polarisedimenticolia bacterium]|nr:benzoyl-CoA 2,3-epoxidase subunit BoxB [Candidatus Polarisedimenticolia bacterium]
MTAVDLSAKIPNNVNLNDDPVLRRALEHWLPKYLEWWRDMGPSDFSEDSIYLRTAVGVGKGGWANFDYVRMPEYRWGIFLAEPEPGKTIGFGDVAGQPVWNAVPGEMRNRLRRLIVTQADTEPASVEQQRLLGHTAPSLYDLRNLFQVNVEEGRHLWAMVYLLQRFFGFDGRDEAEDLLRRRSGNPDNPRILQAFNKKVEDWLAFFCFTTFTDRDGKYQLAALAESGFDPLARTTQFMLTEEAHHLSVGENGIGRVVQRTAELMKEGTDPRSVGAVPLEILQRYVNEWAAASHDLFGGEDSSNAAEAFSSGLKGRYREGDGIYKDPRALDQYYEAPAIEDGRPATVRIPLRRAMNALLLEAYHADCQRICARWNRTLAEHGLSERITLPSTRFWRQVGMYAGQPFSYDGAPCGPAEAAAQAARSMPSQADHDYVRSIMVPVRERGKFANWIAPPHQGINNQPIDFEYVTFH